MTPGKAGGFFAKAYNRNGGAHANVHMGAAVCLTWKGN